MEFTTHSNQKRPIESYSWEWLDEHYLEIDTNLKEIKYKFIIITAQSSPWPNEYLLMHSAISELSCYTTVQSYHLQNTVWEGMRAWGKRACLASSWLICSFPMVGMERSNVCYLFYLVSLLASAHGKNRYLMLIKSAYLTGDIEKL